MSVLRLDAQAIELQRIANARGKIEGHDFASKQAADYGMHGKAKSSRSNCRSARNCRILCQSETLQALPPRSGLLELNVQAECLPPVRPYNRYRAAAA